MDMPVTRSINPFQAPAASFSALNADAIAKILASVADVTLVLNKDGVIQDVAFGSEELYDEGFGAWVGLPWIETVTPDSRHKIEDTLRDTALLQPTRWRQVNHPTPAGEDVPLRYSALQILDDGGIIAFGRDLRSVAALQQRLVDAQMSMERDYAKLRQTELRYRLLFQMSSEAILIADAVTGKISDANPAAVALLGETAKKLTSHAILDLFENDSVSAMRDMISSVRGVGSANAELMEFSNGRGRYYVTASLFRQATGAQLLIRIAREEAEPVEPVQKARGVLSRIVDRLPDGFVVCNPDLRVLTANSAFLDLIQFATEEQIRGESIERWLGRSSVDLNLLIASLREHGSVRNFVTVLNGALGSVEEVEVTAVSVTNSAQPCLGFVIRTMREKRGTGREGQQLTRSVEQLTGLVGRVPLKDLVRETSDLIEKLCIEAALELTGDNRASAAEMLGLSRQSLYVKLRRFGLGDLATEETPE